jgi:HAD superfamily hydrolase (TIGR01509 family)
MAKIRNIVFDLGNVLLKYDPKGYLESLGYPKDTVSDLMKLIFHGIEWKLADQGLLSNDQLIEIYQLKAPQYYNEINYVMRNWHQLMVLMDESRDLFLEVLDKGYNVYILSNYPEYKFLDMWERTPIFSKAHGSVISYQIKLTKPSKEIYQHLLEKYDLKPEETIFLDDLQENINGAKKVGIHGIRFRNVPQVKQELKAFGVELT